MTAIVLKVQEQGQLDLPLVPDTPAPVGRRIIAVEAVNDPLPPPIELSEPIQRAMARIEQLLGDGHPVVVAYSAGKDSGALSSLTLNAARALVERGQRPPPIVLVHSQTGVEQPEIAMLAIAEISKMKDYARRHRIEFIPLIGQPTLNASFPVRVIGGRALPAFPDTHSDCSKEWKVDPNERLLKQALVMFKEKSAWKEPVVMTGVRKSESQARDQRIAARGEVADGIWTNELGKLRASPILDWDVDDVWEYLGLCNGKKIDSYTDYTETMRIYRDVGGSSCVIVADMRSQSQSKPCGSRTGCWSCTKIKNDRSMSQMMESDPVRYAYLEPLARLRNFISATQYDWDRRQWVGRTIDDKGTIAIAPDVYSPKMLEELLRYSLSAQKLSGVQIISAQQLVAIDARWSLYGVAPPFTALKILREVEAGKVELAPVLENYAKTKVPTVGRLPVGNSWREALGENVVGGLMDGSAMMFAEECGFDFKQLPGGTLVLDYEGDDSFEVDEEGAQLFIELEADRYIAEHCRESSADWTWGMKTYLRYGTIVLGKGRSRMIDDIMRRTQWRQQNGLHGQLSLETLIDRYTAISQAHASAQERRTREAQALAGEGDEADEDIARLTPRG